MCNIGYWVDKGCETTKKLPVNFNLFDATCTLHVSEGDSDEERGGSTLLPKDDGDIVEVPPRWSTSSLFRTSVCQ